ncbi:terpenoid cyclases/protein prenyltransferase alpha-alpha toroid [Geopyxis carbonaria]|nr:terpenoid cyclases/protein prenyltransferase alpha-alpha toroid [Geopyxis carbonaria]
MLQLRRLLQHLHLPHPAAPPPAISISIEMTTPPAPTLHLAKHTSYWLRCLKTCLPSDYTATDLTRTTLGYFSLAALDLLGVLATRTTPAERAAWAAWVYANQLPAGGFRGSPATHGVRAEWDPPNLPATLFAVLTLLALGDDLDGVKRNEVLEWLPTLQREDGSFGEWAQVGAVVGTEEDRIVGGRDMRYVYFAAALRWILGGEGGRELREGQGGKTRGFDVPRCVQFIAASQTWDGGLADAPFGEAHAGMTYCGLAALSLLGHPSAVPDPAGLLRWLVSRQTPFEAHHGMHPDEIDWRNISPIEAEAAHHVEVGSDGHPLAGGFNGRCNKTPDTCYSFWVGASLAMLRKVHLMDVAANRRFLLDRTQHFIGGFAKLPAPGGVPDILHSYLGLAALALVREAGVNTLDPALCVSMQAKERLMALPWWRDTPPPS